MSKEVANFKMKHNNGQTKSGNESTLIDVLVTMFFTASGQCDNKLVFVFVTYISSVLISVGSYQNLTEHRVIKISIPSVRW